MSSAKVTSYFYLGARASVYFFAEKAERSRLNLRERDFQGLIKIHIQTERDFSLLRLKKVRFSRYSSIIREHTEVAQ